MTRPRALLLALTLGALLSPGLVAAQRGDLPSTMTMRWVEAWNQHRRGGASGRRLDARVKLRFLKGYRLEIEDSGVLEDSNLDNRFGYSVERKEWGTVWSGTFERDGLKLMLRLKQASRTCVESATDAQKRVTHTPCEPASSEARFACEPVVLTVTPVPTDASPDPMSHVEHGLSCLPSAPVKGRASPTPWEFSRRGCLEIVGPMRGYGKRLHRPCSKP